MTDPHTAVGRRSYDLHGVVLDVVSADPTALDLLDGRLLTFLREPDGAGRTAGVVLHLRTAAEGPPPRPPPGARSRPVYDLPSGQVRYFDDGDVLFVDHEGVTMVADFAASVVETFVGRLNDRARWLATHPFFTMALVEALKRRRLHSIHAAACAAEDGSVVLLAGQSGAGKTTLALALARAGFGFLGDDTAFLAHDGATLDVLGFPDEVDVTDDTAALLPELGHLLGRPKPAGAVKHRVRAEEVYGVPVVEMGPVTALVFPRIGGCPDSTLAPLSPDEALMELLPNVLLTEPCSSQAHLDTLGRLAFGTPAYRMTVGSDLDRAAGALAPVASL